MTREFVTNDPVGKEEKCYCGPEFSFKITKKPEVGMKILVAKDTAIVIKKILDDGKRIVVDVPYNAIRR